ncbi:MAG: peptidase M61 [Pseudomonadota bacterium]
MPALQYTIVAHNPSAHLFQVTCTVTDWQADEIVFRLPNWIPGSYMIREFARHIVRIEAFDAEGEVALEKLDKCRWRAKKSTAQLTLRYKVYAWDLSVRAAHLDDTHGYFNGTSVFLLPEGGEDVPCELQIEAPPISVGEAWQVATSLESVAVDERGFGRYRAQNYEDLIDHPVEMGSFERFEFTACGVPHELVLSGIYRTDGERICTDLQRICEYHIQFFGEPAPFDRYVFLTMVVGDGYGGLEHRFSTSLLVSRDTLPAPGESIISDRYMEFLGLCSHEYFHAWNVKRMRPHRLATSSLDVEAHTELLWAFEGITSYYDDLALVRAGLIDKERYLGVLGRTITRVHQGPGRHVQSVAQSSFDAWTRFYKQDENAPNAIVSYYAKGSLVALALDLKLREVSEGTVTLDHLMRELWRRRDEVNGMSESAIEALASELAGQDLTAFFQLAVHGTDDLPLAALFDQVGVALLWRHAKKAAVDIAGRATPGKLPLAQGLRLRYSSPLTEVTHVLTDSAAQRAGVSAGDTLIAFDGVKASEKNVADCLARRHAGDSIELVLFRRDELQYRTLVLKAAVADHASLEVAKGQIDRVDNWLSIAAST